MRYAGLALIPVVLAACREGPATRDPLEEIQTPVAVGDPAVARVDGVPILASEVSARRALRDGGASLDDLILEDLLAFEARRQGLLVDLKVRDAARRAMAQALIEVEFENQVRPQDLPEALLRRAYEKNYRFYNNPEVREIEHLLVRCPAREPPARQEVARQLAEKLLAEVLRRRPESLEALRAELQEKTRAAGFELRYERLSTSRAQLERDFADAVFTLQIGELGKRPVKSSYGWHLARAISVKLAVSRPFETVREDVRPRLWTEYRQMKFREWLAELRTRYGARVAEAAHVLFRSRRGGERP